MSSSVKLTWCKVWLMNLRVNTCVDIGCICGLTPVEISKSNWVSQWAEFKWKGKPRFWINVAQHTHADATLIQPCLSKYFGEIEFLVSINFTSSLVLKTGRAISLFPHFCFWISTRYKDKCGGDLSELSCIYTRDLPQHVHNTERTSMQKAKTNWC